MHRCRQIQLTAYPVSGLDHIATVSANADFTSCLTEIAKSIALYLHDERSPYRALAIDLCSRGFPVWQQYVDAVEMLRALFALATSSRKESTLAQPNVGQQARSAVLHIASGNSPLFMTTVSMDIMQPKSLQHRKSVMQLVIFLIHKVSYWW
jgi:WD repeat-containing protein 7